MARTQHSKLIDKVGTSSSPVSEVNTEQLINGADSGIFETLKDAGFEQGDFLPLYTHNALATRQVNFTATGYTHDTDFMDADVMWNDLFPSGATPQLMAQLYVYAGTDESVDIRIYNYTDSEEVSSVTGITGQNVIKTISPTSYTPTTTGSRLRFFLQWRTSPGTNTCYVRYPMLALGVKI